MSIDPALQASIDAIVPPDSEAADLKDAKEGDDHDSESAKQFVLDVNAFGQAVQNVLSVENPQPSVALWTFLTMAIRVHRMYPPDAETSIEEVLEEVAKYEANQQAKNRQDRQGKGN